jgi:putative oxidoreductase
MFTSAVINKDIALLLLRLTSGGLMAILHGWPKLQGFAEMADSFADPFGIGSAASLILIIFAEFVCALAVAIGLFTRAFTIPLIFAMAVAAFMIHGGDPLAEQELSLVYLGMYLTVLLAGAGKYSVSRISFR